MSSIVTNSSFHSNNPMEENKFAEKKSREIADEILSNPDLRIFVKNIYVPVIKIENDYKLKAILTLEEEDKAFPEEGHFSEEKIHRRKIINIYSKKIEAIVQKVKSIVDDIRGKSTPESTIIHKLIKYKKVADTILLNPEIRTIVKEIYVPVTKNIKSFGLKAILTIEEEEKHFPTPEKKEQKNVEKDVSKLPTNLITFPDLFEDYKLPSEEEKFLKQKSERRENIDAYPEKISLIIKFVKSKVDDIRGKPTRISAIVQKTKKYSFNIFGYYIE